MPWGLKRYQQTGELHFITSCCYHRRRLMGSESARDQFIIALERTRKWYGFYIGGYVVKPEHVHLLISEPERGNLAVALQMLKQVVSRKLRAATAELPFLAIPAITTLRSNHHGRPRSGKGLEFI